MSGHDRLFFQFGHQFRGYGHQVGDEVLKYVAKVGKGLLNAGDTLYRYGGEELVVIFTESNWDEAYAMLEAWRRIVSLREWREEELSVSFSGGFAAWQPGTSAEALFRHTDSLLYHAKRMGKNNIQRAAEEGR